MTADAAAPSPPRRLSRRRRVVFATLTVLGALLLSASTLEVCLRLAVHRDDPDCYLEDPELGKRLVPGYQGLTFDKPVSVNSFGMRDGEATLARRPGSRRVVALGDSWTFGAAVAAEKAWPEQLEQLLGGRDVVDVLNTGVPGYETYHEARYYQRDLTRFEHDLVLVGFYPVNDVHDKASRNERRNALREVHPVLYDLYRFPKRLMISQVYEDWRKRRKMRRRVERYARAHPDGAVRPFAGEVDWTELYTDAYRGWPLAKEALRSIGDTARACGARGAVVLFPDLRDLRRYVEYCHPRVAPVLAQVVRDAGLELIDLVDDFRPFAGREPEVSGFSGSTHPSDVGCEVIARAVARELAARGLLER